MEINGWRIEPDEYENRSPCWCVSRDDREANFSHYADAELFAGVAPAEFEPDVVIGARWDGTIPCPQCSHGVPAGKVGSVQCPRCGSMLIVSSYMHTPN